VPAIVFPWPLTSQSCAASRKRHASSAAVALPFYRADVRIEEKLGPRDLVSEADRAAERAVKELLAARRPTDDVWGEEYGGDARPLRELDGLRWGIDPVDGTTNFLWGLPHWCVSIGCEDASGSLVGAVYDPLRGEMFTAARGQGVTLDGQPLVRSRTPALAECLLAWGENADWHRDHPQIEPVFALLKAVAHGRQLGSMALDMGWLADSRVDLYYYESHLYPHDIAQRVICEEAGMEVVLLEESAAGPKAMLAGPQDLVKEALALLGR
jgi:myo-inositol-1(or 4)-monophosphatase